MTKPVVIELTKDTDSRRKGELIEVPSVAVAGKVYPDHKVLRYADGEPYEAPKADKPATRSRKAADKPADDAPPAESPVDDAPAGDAADTAS